MSTFTTACRMVVLSLLLSMPLLANAQSNPLDKKLDHAKELANDGKLDDAEKYMEKLLDKEPSYGDGWDLLANIRQQQYENSKLTDGIFGNLTITTKDKDGKDIKGGDSLAQEVSKMLKSFSPSKVAYSKFIYTLRMATLSSRDAYMSAIYLRMIKVDVNVDSNVNKKALKYFNEAQTEFAAKNYTKAATLYKRACEEQPDFYKARMYLGDCYYAMKSYGDAITYFKEARDRFPFLLEPRKYLVDGYEKIMAYDKSFNEAVQATTVYPDLILLQKLEDAAYLDHRRVDIRWTPRGILPNKVHHVKELNEYVDDDDTTAEGPWVAYKNAGDKIESYCDSNGIITKSNSLTTARYMEVYSWEEMLKKNTSDPTLAEARRMQQQGYLDCYVMISCFHYDFYQQYLDFAKNNKDRIAEYFKAFTVAR